MNAAKYIDFDALDVAEQLMAIEMRRFVKSWPVEFLNVLHQTYRQTLTLEDAHLLTFIWNELQRGNIFVKQYDVGSGPGPDHDVDSNRAILAAASITCFELHCERGGGADDDGWIRIQNPQGFRVSPDWDACSCLIVKQGWSLPLEVGDTHIGNLWFHLLRSRGFVRWPYADRKLHVWLLGESMEGQEYPWSWQLKDERVRG